MDNLPMVRTACAKVVLPVVVCAVALAAARAQSAAPLWSLRAAVRPPVPQVELQSWPIVDLDRFVLHRLERAGLQPSPPADRATLLRRVTFDLTGLPPTTEELAAFLADPRADAYERVVDRLLASPQHGERMAQWWLDLARYTDTNGFDFDGERQMWAWRDWVVQAFANDMPYDQFTTEQIAGDLLPDATLSQRVATGFHRNHAVNQQREGQPGEYHHQYVADRTATFGLTWLGLSIGCAQCHDHKFDPISQSDYFGLYAFWNRMDEKGLERSGNAVPYLELPSAEQGSQLLGQERRIEDLQGRFDHELRQRAAPAAAWCAAVAGGEGALPDLLLRAGLERADEGGAIEGLGSAEFVAGVRGNALALDGRDTFLQLGQQADVDADLPFTASAWVLLLDKGNASSHTVVAKMDEAEKGRGWSLRVGPTGFVQADLTAAPKDKLRVRAGLPIAFGQWHHVAFTYDGSRTAAGVQLFVDGVVVAAEKPKAAAVAATGADKDAAAKKLLGSLVNEGNLRIGGLDGMPLHGRVDEVRLFRRALSAAELVAMVCADFAAMTGAERHAVGQRLFVLHADQELAALSRELAELREQRQQLRDEVPLVSVMAEMREPRATRLLLRGDFLAPAQVIEPAIPAALGSLPQGAAHDRLGLAQWLVAKDNPLVGRVHVNRLWSWFFGRGLVATPDDFGARGERPSHPELLDWLAREFVDGGFRHRAFVRLLVTSATYRQSSVLRPALHELDPDNVLLARAARWRLDAEALRDQALAVAGLLDRRVGGRGVRPWQPEDLWPEVSPVADRHRRGLYVMVERGVPFVTFGLFDAPTRTVSCARRGSSTTPLQALALFNDRNFAEAARGLAERLLGEVCADDAQRLARGFELCTQRQPDAGELAVLKELLHVQRRRYSVEPDNVAAAVAIGDRPPPAELDPVEIAAWSAVAAVLLNLDEVLVRS